MVLPLGLDSPAASHFNIPPSNSYIFVKPSSSSLLAALELLLPLLQYKKTGFDLSNFSADATKLSPSQLMFNELSMCAAENSSGVRTSRICAFGVAFIFSANAFASIVLMFFDVCPLQDSIIKENIMKDGITNNFRLNYIVIRFKFE